MWTVFDFIVYPYSSTFSTISATAILNHSERSVNCNEKFLYFSFSKKYTCTCIWKSDFVVEKFEDLLYNSLFIWVSWCLQILVVLMVREIASHSGPQDSHQFGLCEFKSTTGCFYMYLECLPSNRGYVYFFSDCMANRCLLECSREMLWDKIHVDEFYG